MKDDTGKYRAALITQYHTGVKMVMDELEDEIQRLLDYANTIDTNDQKKSEEGIETIIESLKNLARKLY